MYTIAVEGMDAVGNLKKYVPWWGHACVEFHDCTSDAAALSASPYISTYHINHKVLFLFNQIFTKFLPNQSDPKDWGLHYYFPSLNCLVVREGGYAHTSLHSYKLQSWNSTQTLPYQGKCSFMFLIPFLTVSQSYVICKTNTSNSQQSYYPHITLS